MEVAATALVLKDSPLKTGLTGALIFGMCGWWLSYCVSDYNGGPLTWDFATLLLIPGVLTLFGAWRIWRSFHPRTRLTVTAQGIWTPESGPVAWADLASYYALFASSKYRLNTYLLLYTTAGQEIEVPFDLADANWDATHSYLEKLNTNPALRYDGVQRYKLKRSA